MPSFRPVLSTWSVWDPDSTASAFVDQRLLAEGDSWFTVSGMPIYNLLQELRFTKATEIVNCALPGDTIKNMARITSNRNFRVAMNDASLRWEAVLLTIMGRAEPPQTMTCRLAPDRSLTPTLSQRARERTCCAVFIVSGGGNDLIDRAAWLLRPKELQRPEHERDAAGFVIEARLKLLLGRIQDGYRSLAGLRDNSPRSSQAPIITHTYDYATPRDAGAFGLGPWLYPAMVDEEVPESQWIPLVRYLIDALANALSALQAEIRSFHVVDTRGILSPARLGERGDSNDWQNEIHPNGDGYEKIARVVAAKLRARRRLTPVRAGGVATEGSPPPPIVPTPVAVRTPTAGSKCPYKPRIQVARSGAVSGCSIAALICASRRALSAPSTPLSASQLEA